MARITEEQQAIIDGFKVIRAKDLEDKSILYKVNGPVIKGEEKRGIIDAFIHSLDDDKENILASFVVMNKKGMPLLLFSLRCGELFMKNSQEFLDTSYLGYNAYEALKKLEKNILSEEQRKDALNIINQALIKGLSYQDFVKCHDFYKRKTTDVDLEKHSDLTRVLASYPAIELKLFATNVSARDYWNALSMPKDKRMGEVLFWTKVVGKTESILDNVGCKYLYLFAADNVAEGPLVQYYRDKLNFGADKSISANKPYFDYTCLFLYQSITDLKKGREHFLDTFNPDSDKKRTVKERILKVSQETFRRIKMFLRNIRLYFLISKN